MNFKLIATHINQILKEGKQAFLTLCASLFVACSFAQQIKTATDTTSIQIGEELKLVLSVEVESTDLVVFPEAKAMGFVKPPRSLAYAARCSCSLLTAHLHLLIFFINFLRNHEAAVSV